MDTLSRVWFSTVGAVLILLASCLVVTGVYQVGQAILSDGAAIHQRLLSAVGYAVIAVAVFDVAKYLLEEEVIRERELRHAGEVRRSLTRFVSTILIAVFLEAIVLIFKVAEHDIAGTLYPGLLLFAGVAMLLGLGHFQRLSVTVERQVGQQDAREDDGKGKAKARD